MMTLDDALLHLGYDEVDETITRKVTSELEEAETYLQGAVGADIFDLMPEDPRVNILLKAYLDDLHDDKGTTSAKASNAKRDMIHSTEWQLKLELAKAREEAEG
jgi:hypothetical protein